MKLCCVCNKKGFILCSICEAVFFCSEECMGLKKHEDAEINCAHSHIDWCKRMKKYMSLSKQLADFPFQFSHETTDPHFNTEEYTKFLKAAGVYGYGYWRHEADYWANHGDTQLGYGALPLHDNPYGLPMEGFALEEEVPCKLPSCIHDWKSYYIWRGFRLDSPIAVLLHFPLTLYHIISTCLHIDFPDFSSRLKERNCLKICLVGVEKEVDMIPVVYELASLLPNMKLNIAMVGPQISAKMHDASYGHKNIQITVHRTLFHNFEHAVSMDLVLGFNAGLGAYMSWPSTLKMLKTCRTPTYFTDYCQYSCELSRQAVEKLDVGTISELQINPFRSPIRQYCEEHCMPWYSNGFLYHLKYK